MSALSNEQFSAAKNLLSTNFVVITIEHTLFLYLMATTQCCQPGTKWKNWSCSDAFCNQIYLKFTIQNFNIFGNTEDSNSRYMEHFYSFPDLVNYHAPIFMDGWQMSGEYVTLLAEAPFTLDSTWKLIWDQKVSFVVTILTTEAKVS